MNDGLMILRTTLFDLMPILAVIFGFQYLVIRKPVPHLRRALLGLVMVFLGLALFLFGLEKALFPLGAIMAEQLTSPAFLPTLVEGVERHWTDYYWVYLFAFAIGASTTIAEPALIAVSLKAGKVSGGIIDPFVLRVAVAIGMAFGITLGSFRIVSGAPLHYLVIGAYLLVIFQTLRSPRFIIPLAFDSGGVTTSTITVPIIAALGLSLATAIPGRSPLLDGFGMIALACLFPIITVMGYAQIAEWRQRRLRARQGSPQSRPGHNHGDQSCD
jgi:hypothetical protein